MGPGQLLRSMAQLYAGIRAGRPVEEVTLTGANLPEIAKHAYFKETGFTRKGLYPDDFTGVNICAVSQAQSWSWKPAIKTGASAG